MRWGKVLGALCVCAVALLLCERFLPQALEAKGERAVAEECLDGRDQGAVEALGAVAWLRVEGTGVSYPVMQADASDPFFYLRRGTDGEPNQAGSLFCDFRTRLDAPHALVYGHHMGNTGRMFSDLAQTWRQERLSDIGDAVLTVAGRETRFVPLFAMRVDKSFEPVQRFGDSVDVPGLLTMVGSVASSTNEGWQPVAQGCDRMLTLVTCSEDTAGERWRCVTVFGHVAEDARNIDDGTIGSEVTA